MYVYVLSDAHRLSTQVEAKILAVNLKSDFEFLIITAVKPITETYCWAFPTLRNNF